MGSLYDALYGTDAISESDNAERSTSYNPTRGNKVISYAKEFLDKNFPLQNCSHKDVNSYKIDDNSLLVETFDGTNSHLKIKSQYIGYQGDAKNPSCILLKNNNLHIEILVNKKVILELVIMQVLMIL